jgi:hypothetical protein
MTATAHTIYTWTIDEHPNPDACIKWMRDNLHDLYWGHDENHGSLEAFCHHFGVTLRGRSIDLSAPSYVTIDAEQWETDCREQELTGVRLWKYLQNNGYLQIRNRWRPCLSNSGNIVQLLDGNCPLTGYFMDEVLLDAVREFIAHPSAGTNMQDIVNDAAHRFTESYIAEWEYTYSDDGLRDTAEANRYEFTEDGRIFCPLTETN